MRRMLKIKYVKEPIYFGIIFIQNNINTNMDCRMFLFHGDVSEAKKLQIALINAAKNDVLDNNRIHKDGWGSVIINKDFEFYQRSKNSIFEDNIDIFSNFNSILTMIAHARLASPTEQKRGWLDAHPFRFFSENGTFYIAHNGYIDKKKLSTLVNIEDLTDTQAFTIALGKMGGKISESMEELIDFLHIGKLAGALNLLCLYIHNNKIEMCYYSDFESEKFNYLSLIEYNDNSNFSVMSSTVAYYMGLIDKDLNPLEKGVSIVEKNKLFIKEVEI